MDALYAATLVRLNTWWSQSATGSTAGSGMASVQTVSYFVARHRRLDGFFDHYIVNTSFDGGCQSVSRSGQILSLLQGGRIQSYMRIIGCALIVLVIYLLWGAKV